MSTMQSGVSPQLRLPGRRFGYGLAVVINVVMLIVVQNILDWGSLPFLTDEFTEVVPWISLSLVASILANLIYQFNDSPTVKSTGQILVNLISVSVSYVVLQVFPFDFSGYGFDWAIVVRIVLILAIVGSGIGVLTETIKVISSGPEKERRQE
ncbi:MAG TPA: hypothetical protein VFV13_00935 [Acidimicrobiia bacterium]|nr:hypothetical protein [Acidimicrobiia bacterium]